jgi:hypothetical protein
VVHNSGSDVGDKPLTNGDNEKVFNRVRDTLMEAQKQLKLGIEIHFDNANPELWGHTNANPPKGDAKSLTLTNTGSRGYWQFVCKDDGTLKPGGVSGGNAFDIVQHSLVSQGTLFHELMHLVYNTKPGESIDDHGYLMPPYTNAKDYFRYDPKDVKREKKLPSDLTMAQLQSNADTFAGFFTVSVRKLAKGQFDDPKK